MGAPRAMLLGANHADRIEGLVFIAPAVPLPPSSPRARAPETFTEPREAYAGWEKFNRHYWLEHYEDFLEFFFGQVFSEPHSTKQIEDGVGWGLDTDPETLALTVLAPAVGEAELVELAARIRARALVIHGTEDAIRTHGVRSGAGQALERTIGHARGFGS